MNKIEKRLTEEKERLNAMTTPNDLEARLRNALDSVPVKKRRRVSPRWIAAAVAALFFFVVVSYNYNAFAFYGKTLFGFDELLSGTLQELNEEGAGQAIDKEMKLADGTTVLINGIMSDENRFLLYYTLTNPKGINMKDEDLFYPRKITGTFTNSNVESGIFSINDDETELKGTLSFEPVSPFSKTLTLHYDEHLENEQMREGALTFPYNPNKAMATKIKHSIKKKIDVDQGTVTFHSITATPTMTVIDGKLNVKNIDRISLPLEEIELIANGEPVEQVGSSRSSGLLGSKFDLRFDALPLQLESLELVVKKFVGYQTLQRRLSLETEQVEPVLLYKNKELWITNITMTKDGVEITIATDQDVMLDGVAIEVNNEKIPLSTTINQIDSLRDGKNVKERTLLFDSTDIPQALIVEGMHYMKTYDDVIEITVK